MNFEAKLTVDCWRSKLKTPWTLQLNACMLCCSEGLLQPLGAWSEPCGSRADNNLFCFFEGKICNSIFVLTKKDILWRGLLGTWIFTIRAPGRNSNKVWDGLWSADTLTNVWFNVEKCQHNDPFIYLLKHYCFLSSSRHFWKLERNAEPFTGFNVTFT